MKEWIRKLLTEIDNETPCFVRVAAAVALLVGFGMVVCDGLGVLKTHFDFQAYGIGLGATFTSIGAALKLKKDTPIAGATGE